MIYGIGHDIIENKRIDTLIETHGQRFLNKILTQQEQNIYLHHANKINYIAKRFAAKEAFAKACGTGLRSPILMHNISVLNNELGKPYFVFNENINLWLIMRKITNCHISISDDELVSSAFVVLET